MTGGNNGLTELGELVEAARTGYGLSIRAAAERAGISEARWRQVVTGWQKSGATRIRARPSRRTVEAMARAVGVDQATAIKAAGFANLPPLEEILPAGPPTFDDVTAWAEQKIREVWQHPKLSDRDKQELVADIRHRVDDLLTINERLDRTG